ncbi:hypothetical protein [Pseudomonas hormoni]|jgi:hypothetical protein
MSSNIISPNTAVASKTPPTESKVGMAVAGLLFLSILYLVACVISGVWLALEIPVSETEMWDVSFLSPRVGAQWHGMMVGGLMLVFALLQLVNRNLAMGALCVLFGCCVILGTSEVAALRQGLLTGDVRLGCYVYESLECHKMVDVAVGDSKSIYREQGKSGLNGENYAAWYAPKRARFVAALTSRLPSTMPGVALLKSPFTLLQIDEVKARLSTQRQELARFRAAAQQVIANEHK